jgi:proteasome lid subunit RPN8/RPN11
MSLENWDAFMQAMLEAAEMCSDDSDESGGIILEKDRKDYRFVKLKSKYQGKPEGPALYEVCDEDLKNLVFPEISKGWRFFASFHTHPSFSATPSSIDLTTLFRGFKHNVIYSIATDTFSYSTWEDKKSVCTYIPRKKLN